MDIQSRKKIEEIWRVRSSSTPVLFRQPDGPVLLKMPFAEHNRQWLQNGRRRIPKWLKPYKCWELPKAWFNDLVRRLVDRYGKLFVIQPYREQEKCAPNCWNAEGFECSCSCMGANHGSTAPGSGWLIVSDTFATRWHEKELACRLIEKQMVASPRR